jgi:uncharacterized protein (TIGR02611 family)
MKIRKALRVTAGFLLLLVGLVMAVPGVPGPGLAVMIAGLIVLSPHFEWARRLLEWAKRKADEVRKRVRK